MSRPLITIDDFKLGIVDDPTQPLQNGFQDFLGLNVSLPDGVCRADMVFTNSTNGTASSGTPRALITDFEQSSVNGSDRLYSIYPTATGIEISIDTGSAVSSFRTYSPSTTLKVPTLVSFGGNLYYTSKLYLGRYTAAGVFTDNAFAFDATAGRVADTKFKPTQEFRGSLWVGDGRYVARLDADLATWEATKFTLPVGYRVRCMESFGDFLAIGTEAIDSPDTDFTQSKAQFAKVFLWDTLSAYASYIIDVNVTGGVQALRNINNNLYLIARKSQPPLPNGLSIYKYNGSNFTVVRSIANMETFDQSEFVYPEAVTNYDGNLIVGISPGVANSKNGLWELNLRTNGLRRFCPAANYGADKVLQIGAVYSGFNTRKLITSWNVYFLSDRYGYDWMGVSDAVSVIAWIITQQYPIGKDFGTLLKGVQMQAYPMRSTATASSVIIEYKIDNEANWNTLGSIDYSNQDDILYGIYKKARSTIQFKFTFVPGSATTADVTRVTQFKAY